MIGKKFEVADSKTQQAKSEEEFFSTGSCWMDTLCSIGRSMLFSESHSKGKATTPSSNFVYGDVDGLPYLWDLNKLHPQDNSTSKNKP